MTKRVRGLVAAAASVVAIAGLAEMLLAQNLGTLGTGVAGESTALTPGKWTPPTGPAPRLPNGKPDFSGVWDHPYVPDMSGSNARNPALQKGAGPLPYTPAGLENIKSYDPEKNGDYTGMCMPFGLMRSVNAPYPFQIMQNEKYVTFLFEQNNWFYIVPFKNEHSKEPNPTWFGESIAKWEGDTLVIDTIGFTRLDTRATRTATRCTGADTAPHRRRHCYNGSGLLLRAVDERAHVHDGQHPADGILLRGEQPLVVGRPHQDLAGPRVGTTEEIDEVKGQRSRGKG